MKQLLLISTLLSVCALSISSLSPDNRYGAHQSRNSLNYRGGNSYSAQHRHGPSLPHAPSAPHSPSSPHSPRLPHAPRAPVAHSYSAPRSGGYGSAVGYGSRGVGGHHSAPVHYGGGRHFSPAGSSLNEYHHGPAQYGAGPVPYAGGHASAGASHYASSKRSVYQQPQQHQQQSYGSTSRSGYPHQQNYAQSHQHAQSTAQSHGREMKYTIKDPQNKGTTHVTETHVVSNRQMHGAEAEAAMKKLMGSMGPSSNGGFDDFLKGMGLPFY